MESGNKAFGLVILGLVVVGLGGFYGRSRIMHFFKHESASTLISGKSLAVGGRVIVEAFGKPYISEDALNQKLEQMLQSDPSTRGMSAATLPPVAKVGFLKDWINFLLIKDTWGKEHNIVADADFQKRYAEGAEALKDSLIINAFVQDLKKSVTVADEEIGLEYHSNKDTYLKTPGGVRCMIVEFGAVEPAQTLEERAHGVVSIADFKALAEVATDGTVSDLGFIDDREHSSARIAKFPPEVREVVFEHRSDPSTLVAANDAFFVVFKTERKIAKFHSLEEVAASIKAKLEESKQREALEAALSDLRNRANLVIDSEAFGVPKAPAARVLTKEELASVIQEEDAVMENDGDFGDMIMDENN